MKHRLPILLVINILLVSWYFLRPTLTNPEAYNTRRLPSLKQTKRIEIILGNQPDCVLISDGVQWRVENATLSSNTQTIEKLKTAFERTLSSDQEISCDNDDCTQFGIDSDSIQIRMTDRADRQYSFQLGRVIDNEYTYVRFARQPIVISNAGKLEITF